MKKPFVPEPVRALIVRMLQNGHSYRKTAKDVGVGSATVTRIWRRFRTTGLTSLPQRNGGRKPKISQENELELRRLVESKPDATYDELTVSWNKMSGIKVSRSTVIRIVLKLNFSLKKKSKVATEKLTKKNRAKRSSFLHRRKTVQAKRLVFLDEAGFQGSLARTHARSLRGEKAYSFVSSAPAKNFTIAGAIRLDGPVVMRGSGQTMTTRRFLSFLKTSLLPRLRPKDILVMDNLRAHKSKSVRRLLRAWDIKVLYLPPYSPEFNPIEQVWGWMKKRLRSRLNRAAKCFRYAVSGAWRKTASLCFQA
ncbi:MAG: IS630 family transposase, partial [Cytophagaceae bacterium]